MVDGNWVLINDSVTNSDGRCAEFLQREAFRSGRYKLHFAVEKYFKSIRSSTIYPFIEVCSEFYQFLTFTIEGNIRFELGTFEKSIFKLFHNNISRRAINVTTFHLIHLISSSILFMFIAKKKNLKILNFISLCRLHLIV